MAALRELIELEAEEGALTELLLLSFVWESLAGLSLPNI
jgi:hypothetical protein